MSLRIREAARAVVLAPGPQVLLVRFEFPAGTRWATPGGGLDAGEDHVDALRRELREEAGLHDAVIGPHVWNRLHVIPFPDLPFDGQRERYHLVEVPEAFDPRPAFDWATLQAESLHEVRWWTLDELGCADGVVFVPSTLPALVRDLVEHGPPKTAIDVPV